MFDDWAWKSFVRVVEEAREPTPFKSKAQKRYKAQRRRNDIYTTTGGHKSPSTGSPFKDKLKRFGTDRLRFESLGELLGEEIDLSHLELKDTLSPVLWEDGKVREEIRPKLLQIADDFMTSLGLQDQTQDVHLVGSMANYNYSDMSDIDVHIMMDFSVVNEDTDLVRKYFALAKSRWNKNYGLILGGHDVEVYVEDVNKPAIPTARYSLTKDEWIKKPMDKDADIDYDNIRKKVEEKLSEIEEIESLFNKEEYQKAHELAMNMKNKLANFRQSGLNKGGELSTENLVFKVLRRNNMLDKINDYIEESYKNLRSFGL